MRIYECLDLPSSPNPFSQAGRRGTGLLLPSPKLGEGLGVRANPLCNYRSYLIHDPKECLTLLDLSGFNGNDAAIEHLIIGSDALNL